MKKNLFIFFLIFQIGYSQNTISETDKLTATCKVWGFLKYYHPNVAAGKFDWDEELYTILSQTDKTNSKEDFSIIVENWIDKLGAVPKAKIIDKYPAKQYFYKNLDLSWTQKNLLFSKSLSKKLKWIEENRFQGKPFYVYLEINGSREAEMDEPGGWPKIQNERTAEDFTWELKKYRLLTLFRYWNAIEYFAPNKYTIDKEWTACLKDILPRITNPKDELAYHYALLEMVANLNDSHASYYITDSNPHLKLPEQSYNYRLPFEVKAIDNNFIVSKILNKSLAVKNDIQLGDIITTLDSKTVQDYVNLYKNKIPASNPSYLLYQITKWYLGFPNNEIEIEFSRNQHKATKKIETYTRHDWFKDIDKSKDIEKYKILDGDIGYLNLENIYIKDLATILPAVKNTKGIIVDIRNYPHDVVNDLAKFFLATEKECTKQIYADLRYPGRFIWEEPVIYGEENLDNYKGKIVILVNEETMSHAEWTTMCLRVADNAIVMGSQTAGADGANTKINVMFSHFITTFTGKGVFYPDGTETQRIGIVPDIEVKPTIEAIKEGRDEILDRAIEYIETDK